MPGGEHWVTLSKTRQAVHTDPHGLYMAHRAVSGAFGDRRSEALVAHLHNILNCSQRPTLHDD